MAKQKPPMWLGACAPHVLSVEGERGEVKEFSFRLCLDFNALALVEEHTGISLTTPADIFKVLTVSRVRILYWAALQAYQPGEYEGVDGLRAIGSLLSFKNSGAAVDGVWEAFLKAVPEETATRLRAVVEAANEAAKSGEELPAQDPTKTAPATN
jgi:hypothetical protein